MWKIPLFEPNFCDQEQKAVSSVIESRWLTMGERVQAFESKFSRYLGEGVYCTAMSSCTAALHVALLALDVGPGDEVIIPANTFVADINAVALVGAKPVLADCGNLKNWNVTADTIERRVTSKTKAVIVVHFAGYSCNMDEITEMCRLHRLFLIEDVAHAPGAVYKGKACGTFGDYSCFSFFSNKNISIGEGGMIATLSKTLNESAQFLRSHGMTSLTLDRHSGRAKTYDVVRPGLNYRMDEMRAALGIVQLDKLTQSNLNRERLTEYYRKLLTEVNHVSAPFENYEKGETACHILPVLLSNNIDRSIIIDSMKERGVQTSIHYPSFKMFTAYASLSKENETPIADSVANRELTLPLYPTMTFEQVEYVVDSLKEAVSNYLRNKSSN